MHFLSKNIKIMKNYISCKSVFLMIVLLFCSNIVLKAQPPPIFASTELNYVLYNPAYSGINSNKIEFGTHYQNYLLFFYDNEYVGITPNSYSFSFKLPLKNKILTGGGINFLSEESGFYKKTHFDIPLSVRKHFKFGTLFFGINPGVLSEQIIITNMWPNPEPLDTAFKLLLKFGSGLYFTNYKNFYMGFSSQQLFTRILYDGWENIQLSYHTFHLLSAGYNFKFNPGSLFSFQPNFIYCFDYAKKNFYLGLNTIYKDKYSLKLVFDLNFPHATAIGFDIPVGKNFVVSGYYNDFFNSLFAYSFGRFEIGLKYKIALDK